MSKDVLIVRDGVTYRGSVWPSQMPNPGKNKFLVYRNGVFVGAAKTKKDLQDRIEDGYWDACVDAVNASAEKL